jgi:hypothetical protein
MKVYQPDILITKFALNENDIKDTKEMKKGELKILQHYALLELEERQGENTTA